MSTLSLKVVAQIQAIRDTIVVWGNFTGKLPDAGNSRKKGTVMSEGTVSTGNDYSGEIRPHQRFAEYLIQRAEVEGEIVAKKLSEDQLDAILTATTPEELDAAMEMAELVSLKDLEDGTELQINGFHVAPGNRAEFQNSLGVWAVLEAQFMENGTQVNLDSGVERVIGFLRMCEVMERYPVQVRLSKVPTGGGNEMITLLPLRKRAVVGETMQDEGF